MLIKRVTKQLAHLTLGLTLVITFTWTTISLELIKISVGKLTIVNKQVLNTHGHELVYYLSVESNHHQLYESRVLLISLWL